MTPALLILLAAQVARIPVPVPPPIVDSWPAASTSIAASYACFGRRYLLGIERDAAGVRVRDLRGDGRPAMAAADLARWNGWLGDMAVLASFDLTCARDGVVVAVWGRSRGEPAVRRVAVAWTGVGLVRLPPPP